jgi:hypothetical protein
VAALGATTTGIKLPDVVADIDKTTNGHLHLVVATDQHQDHLSGFPTIAAQFSPGKNKQIDHVWLAWTEDPNDQLAKQLGKARDDMAIAVRSAVQAMRATGGDTAAADAVDSLLGFFGDTSIKLGAAGVEGATLQPPRGTLWTSSGDSWRRLSTGTREGPPLNWIGCQVFGFMFSVLRATLMRFTIPGNGAARDSTH